MKAVIKYFPFVFVPFLVLSCRAITPDRYGEPSYTEILEEVWSAINDRYVNFCNMDVNWDEILLKYRKEIKDDMNQTEFMGILDDMIESLRDQHLTIKAGDTGWELGYNPKIEGNYDSEIISSYLSSGKLAGGLHYTILPNTNIGYVYYGSFKVEVSEDDLREVFNSFRNCDGIVFDIRSNGGGNYGNVISILRFLPCHREPIFKNYARKEGGRNSLKFLNIETCPSSKIQPYDKPFVILIGGQSYSSSSLFAIAASQCTNVTLVGSKTSGGTCVPETVELSNGWVCSIPIIKKMTINEGDYENGVTPDYEVMLDSTCVKNGIDNIIQFSCDLIASQQVIK